MFAGGAKMITTIKKEFISNLLEYIIELENSKIPGLAFKISEKWLCHSDCKGCEHNLGDVNCKEQNIKTEG